MSPIRDALRAAWLPAACITLPVLAVIVPAEIDPRGRALLDLLLALVALLLITAPDARDGNASLGSALLFLPLAIAAILHAAGRARALDEATLCVALLTAGLLGAVASGDARCRRLVLITLITLATGAALLASLQHHWLYPQQASELRAIDPVSADALLVRLEAGRPSGPFILPTTLAGFLALVLPATAWSCVGVARRRWLTWAARGAFAVQVYALLLTRSLGGLGVAAAGLLLFLLFRPPRRRAALSLLLATGMILMALLVLSQRRVEIGQAPGADPVSLRIGNWRAAGEMIAAHPLLGVGPGAFGSFYPRFMRAGMNETRYAHNSYLQLAACWGLWIAVPLTALLALFTRRAGRALRGAPEEAACAAGAATFLLHNGIDFTLYQPGLATPAALLIGITLGRSFGEPVEWNKSWMRPALAGAAALLLWHAVIPCAAASLMETARRRAGVGDVAGAARAGQQASEMRPGDPDPQAFLAQIVLMHQMDDAERRRVGERAADRALGLDPEQAVLHHTRALYHAAAGEIAAAYREERQAHRLFPLKPEYRDVAAVEAATTTGAPGTER